MSEGEYLSGRHRQYGRPCVWPGGADPRQIEGDLRRMCPAPCRGTESGGSGMLEAWMRLANLTRTVRMLGSPQSAAPAVRREPGNVARPVPPSAQPTEPYLPRIDDQPTRIGPGPSSRRVPAHTPPPVP